MITSLLNESFVRGIKQKVLNNILFVLLVLPYAIFGQVEFDTITPVDMQLIARDVVTNKGEVIFKGKIDNTSGSYDYDYLNVKVYEGQTYFSAGGHAKINEFDIPISSYVNNIATFDTSSTPLFLYSRLYNYSFLITGKKNDVLGGNQMWIQNVVIGDVYIIQGQSNSVAVMQTPPDQSASLNEDIFIRTFASAIRNDGLLNQLVWNEAHGDGDGENGGEGIAGFVGQWGLKLAKLMVDHPDENKRVPIAIFNGAQGNTEISYFSKEAPEIYPPNGVLTKNNYNRLWYRLNKTNLKEAVRAVFWSQGENDVFYSTSTSDYITRFNQIKTDWEGLDDYPNIEKIYIFQTKSGCSSTIGDRVGVEIKEAQRQLALDSNIHIMQTMALTNSSANFNCHFPFINGYEEFAKRIFKLVDRDFYGNSSYSSDIEPPMITNAYLTSNTTLVVQTDANTLTINNLPALDFIVANAGITNIQIDNSGKSKIIFTLDQNPGGNANITYKGLGAGEDLINSIINSEDLELVCFNEFPIDTSLEAHWSSSSWAPSAPVSTMNAFIEDNYDASDGNIIANNLTINTGVNLNLESSPSSTTSVVVYGDLTINGTFTIGDKESLVMKVDGTTIIGNITKKESSTARNDIHDFTYWSSPVINTDALISSVFSGVDPNRIFYYDQSQSQETVPGVGDYWSVWQLASGTMTSGLGYAAEGTNIGMHNISFTGEPNNGLIQVGVVHQPSSGNDFNLIGNPYPSAIDINLFFDANNNLDGTAYLWTHNTQISAGGDFVVDDYASINSSGGTAACSGCPKPTSNIGSSQGFFVTTANNGSNQVEFNNTMRIANANDQFFKSSNSKGQEDIKVKELDRIWLNLTTQEGGFNQILIGFLKDATNEVDRGYDALKFSGSSNPIAFYSQINKEKYAIQGVSKYRTNQSIILGFDTNIAPRVFTISIDKIEGHLKKAHIYLEDRVLNITHDLKKSDYEFEQATTGANLDRFVLKFNNRGPKGRDHSDKANFKAYKTHHQTIAIRSEDVIRKIKVYDIYGKMLILRSVNSKTFELNTKKIKEGTILIIEAVFENGEVVRKKTIVY